MLLELLYDPYRCDMTDPLKAAGTEAYLGPGFNIECGGKQVFVCRMLPTYSLTFSLYSKASVASGEYSSLALRVECIGDDEIEPRASEIKKLM